MTSLPDVTLCCVDTRFPELGFAALLRSSRNIDFGGVVFITNCDFVVPEHTIRKLRIVRTGSISSVEAYSSFMVKKLADHILTSHCLIIQWDGFIIHPESWSDRFLAYDYIGAPWMTHGGLVVGNGGFSLRSAKLLKALTSEEINPHHPEDDCICVTNRRLLETNWNISFAPVDVANEFAFEFTPYEQQFGFHGLSNFPDILEPHELQQFVDRMPEALFVNEYFIGFCKKAFAQNDHVLLSLLSKKIAKHLAHPDGRTYSRKQVSFLVESLIYLGLYKSAFTILTDRTYDAEWKLTYLKIILRRTIGSR
jgi:hypothetical protein